MQILHARSTINLFVAADDATGENAARVRTDEAFSVDTYIAPTGAETGATANRSTKLYRASHTILGLDTLALDLTSLTDPFGAAVSFSRVNGIWIKNTGTVDCTLESTLLILGDCTLFAGGTAGASSPSPLTVSGLTKTLTFTMGNGSGSVAVVILGS